jgi:tetratricopeptide (TPR) repeat protein
VSRRAQLAAGALLALGVAAAPTAQAQQAPASEAVAAAQPKDAEAQLAAALEHYSDALEEPDRSTRLAGFARAERAFARILASGAHSAALYTNLGNAALQAEHSGLAVLAYRRALRIDADAPRALQNLEHVRRQLPEWVPRPEPAGAIDTFFFWHRTLPRAQRMLAASVGFALAGALAAGSIRTRNGALRGAALLVLLGWALLMSSVALDDRDSAARDAVVTLDGTPARAADSALAPLALPDPLPAGTEVSILERRSPWLRVRLANGRDAWVAESSTTRVDAF